MEKPALFDAGAVLTAECASLAGISWFAAAAICLRYDLSDDLAAPFIGDQYMHPQAIGVYLALVLSTSLLSAAAVALGYRAQRRVRLSAGSLYGRRTARLGMVSAVGVAILLALLVLFTVWGTYSDYADWASCHITLGSAIAACPPGA